MTDTTSNDEPATPTGAAIVQELDAWSAGTSDPELRSLLNRAGDHIEFIETEAEAVRNAYIETMRRAFIASSSEAADEFDRWLATIGGAA